LIEKKRSLRAELRKMNDIVRGSGLGARRLDPPQTRGRGRVEKKGGRGGLGR